MGEEYAEDNPYQYFISHTDKGLVEAVREGRKKEFASFNWSGEVPDPQGEETFNRCKLDWEKINQGKYKVMLDWYKTLIRMRKEWPALSDLSKAGMHVEVLPGQGLVQALVMHRQTGLNHLVAFFNFGVTPATYQGTKQTAGLRKVLNSTDAQWQPGDAKTTPNALAMPDELNANVALTIPALSVVVYGTKV
jgi:maltooligosyltrehalose trehalohydrolase